MNRIEQSPVRANAVVVGLLLVVAHSVSAIDENGANLDSAVSQTVASTGATFADSWKRFSADRRSGEAGRTAGEQSSPCDCCLERDLRFSLDIGSASELSMRQPDGLGGFDCGDVYGGPVSGGATVCPLIGGVDGLFLDDGAVFGPFGDPDPDPPSNPVIGYVPVGDGCDPDVCHHEYFDLDGVDANDIPLDELGFLPDEPLADPIRYVDVSGSQALTVAQLGHVMLSFDDDAARSWAAPMGIPVNSSSPSGVVYGTKPRGDEVIGLVILTTSTGQVFDHSYPLRSERRLHPLLAPNPTADDESEDDDVDALDYCLNGAWVFFSADSEATGGLDPGAVYLKGYTDAAGMPLPLVSPDIHLGLSAGVDIDGIEFMWIRETANHDRLLALVFSVDRDDPYTTTIDESGGLDPGALYASHLDGTSFELLSSEVIPGGDIDAITGAHISEEIPESRLLAGLFSGDILEVDRASGSVTNLGNIGHQIGGMASNKDNHVLTMWNTDNLVQVNLDNPAGSVVLTPANPPDPGICRAMAISCNGDIFLVLDGDEEDVLWMIASFNFQWYYVGGISGYTNITGLAFDNCNGLYAVSQSDGLLQVSTFDGTVTSVLGPCAVPENGRRTIEFDFDGALYGADDDLLSIDPFDGCCDSRMLYPDLLDLASGLAIIEDTTDCGPADLDGDGVVGFSDLILLLAAWGPCPGCLEDLDGDGIVGFNDLVLMLADWGVC